MDERRAVSNSLGPIADSYDELQSIPELLAVARSTQGIAPGSAWQAVRALFQGIEIALVALEQVTAVLRRSCTEDDPPGVARATEWLDAFGRTWVDLAWRMRDVADDLQSGGDGHRIDVSISPNWKRLHEAEAGLNELLLPLVERIDLDPQLRERLTLDLLNYLMLQRIGLEYAVVEGAPAPYGEFLRPDAIRAVVLERRLEHDSETVFLQFRTAHQIPEILIEAVNDHLEVAVGRLQAKDCMASLPILRRADRLLDAVVVAAGLLADNLRCSEYHEIRENLGLTSGSHSVGLHYHLMRDLYPQLRETVAGMHDAHDPGTGLVRSQVRSIGLHLDRWRLAHLNLPRNNLGGAGTGTRSLTGARDALLVVGRMRDRQQDAATEGAAPIGFRATDWDTGALALGPLERRLLARVAERTQERFRDVQERRGYFAAGSAFQPPAERIVRPEGSTRT
ncbi:hypothetical protein ACQPZQ_20435 [Pseudonocardia sp. CA-142604]|uniref:hypothetical protein n=1 Tax=Pseudonocardia sp. CA-142604 TaxID=3240024 RepID=UPI003D8E9B7B